MPKSPYARGRAQHSTDRRTRVDPWPRAARPAAGRAAGNERDLGGIVTTTSEPDAARVFLQILTSPRRSGHQGGRHGTGLKVPVVPRPSISCRAPAQEEVSARLATDDAGRARVLPSMPILEPANEPRRRQVTACSTPFGALLLRRSLRSLRESRRSATPPPP